MSDSLQAIVRTILEPLLPIPMPWRLLVIIFILIPVFLNLTWRVTPRILARLSQLIFLCVEVGGNFLLLPEYFFSKNIRNRGKQPPELVYLFGDLLRAIVEFFYKISLFFKKVLEYALAKKKRWRPHARWFVITAIALPLIWFAYPSIGETQAGRFIFSGVNWWYCLEGWTITGKWGLSPFRFLPEKFIRDYIHVINDGQYQKAWNLLSPNFQNDKKVLPKGYNSYLSFWRDQVEVTKISRVRLISRNIDLAEVEVNLKYLRQNRIISQDVLRFQLAWNSQKGTWVIYKVLHVKK